MTASPGRRVLLAAPRGYCAGVDRAVIAVEKALEQYGAPVYVRHEIVHNKYVVQTLEKEGRDLRRADGGGPPAEHRDVLRARRRPRRPRRSRAWPPRHHRRHLPARHQGPQGSRTAPRTRSGTRRTSARPGSRAGSSRPRRTDRCRAPSTADWASRAGHAPPWPPADPPPEPGAAALRAVPPVSRPPAPPAAARQRRRPAPVRAAAPGLVAVRTAQVASCIAPLDQLRSVYVPNSPTDTPSGAPWPSVRLRAGPVRHTP
ncbi:4-hydroxy-3-methylbut-2-enyl diphosphate reductase [Streptomyces tendae]